MTIKPVADLYLIKYKDGRLYKCTRDAEEAVDAIGFGFEVEEFVSLDNHRAAMLQGAEPVSNRDELPLDYLQGQKDGLEWAAQLAEANHPHTGDWLYDDPVELAKAIRKGPDMPEACGNSPVIPDGLNIRAVAALREAVRNQWLKSDGLADKVYWKSMHDIANEIVSAMLTAAPQQEVK